MNWQLVPNRSWGENQKQMFGEKNLGYGYVICKRNRHSKLIAIASIHEGFKEPREEVDATAKLMVNAPKMFELIQAMAEKGDKDAIEFITSFNSEKSHE